METIQEFCNVSGLKMNLEKSRAMCSSNISRRKRESLSNSTSIRMTSNLGKYLGVPLIVGRVTKSLFNPILEKINRRLAT